MPWPETQQELPNIDVSLGIASILKTFNDLSMARDKPSWDTYMVNVETLIRDRKDKNLTSREAVARATLTDCRTLAQYIAAYNRLIIAHRKPLLVFYLPDYSNIPKIHFREKLPKGTEERWAIRDTCKSILLKEGFPQAVDDLETAFSAPGTTIPWPHVELLRDLMKSRDGMRFSNTLMISHVPLDFHLYKSVQTLTILESFTGKLKIRKDWGRKVFNDEVFPFNKYTHLLLGDKWYLKSLVDSKTRKKLKERAAIKHWNILPDKSVLEDILSMNIVNPSVLTEARI